MRKPTMWLVFTALLAIAGCIEYEEDLRLNADGSGVAYIRYALSQMLAMPMAAGESSGDSEEMPITEDGVRKMFANKPGLKLSDVSVSDEDGRRVISFTLAFDTVESLQKSGFGPFKGVFKLVRNADDTYAYERKMDTESSEAGDSGSAGETEKNPDTEQKPGMEAQPETEQEPGTEQEPETGQNPETETVPDEAMNKMGETMAKGMMEGMSQAMDSMAGQLPKFTFKLRLPKNIVETNADYYSGNYAEWKVEFSAEQMQKSDSMGDKVFKVRTNNVDPSSLLLPIIVGIAAAIVVIAFVLAMLRGRKKDSATAGQFSS